MRIRELLYEEPRSREDIEARIKELEAQIADLTPGFNPVTPDEGDDQSVAYTSPRQSREILKNPEKYKYGTDIPKDPGFIRPLIQKDPNDIAPRGHSDFTTPQGMPTDRIHSKTSPLGIDRNAI